MKKEFQEELPKEIYEKVKVQTLVLFCFAIVMIFAGFISAYIVQSSDGVWVRITPPPAFVSSTIAVIAGSVFLFLGKLLAKKGILKAITPMLFLALLSGIGFCYFQFQGWKQLVQGGNLMAVSIINPMGQYGQKFVFEKDGEPIEFDGQDYVFQGETLPEDEVVTLRQFANDVCEGQYQLVAQKIELQNDWSPYSIVSVDRGKVQFDGDQQLWAENDSLLSRSSQLDLFNFSLSVHLGMEYFKLTGEYGKDFVLTLNNEDLEFSKKQFFYKEIILTEEEQAGIETYGFADGAKEYSVKDGKLKWKDNGEEIDISKGNWMFTYQPEKVQFNIRIENGVWTRDRSEISKDDYALISGKGNTTSSYFYVMTGVHFLHILGGLIYLIRLFIMALNKRFTADNHLKIKLGGIYWHVLGGLWLILFFFFQYYH